MTQELTPEQAAERLIELSRNRLEKPGYSEWKMFASMYSADIAQALLDARAEVEELKGAGREMQRLHHQSDHRKKGWSLIAAWLRKHRHLFQKGEQDD